MKDELINELLSQNEKMKKGGTFVLPNWAVETLEFYKEKSKPVIPDELDNQIKNLVVNLINLCSIDFELQECDEELAFKLIKEFWIKTKYSFEDIWNAKKPIEPPSDQRTVQQEDGKCIFIKAFIGKCNEHAVHGEYCKEHSELKCCVCGLKAARDCPETLGLVCGAPLCDNCDHHKQS